MHFCTFISHFNMSMSVSALFTVPQQHYDFLPLYRVEHNYFLFILFLGRKEFYVHSVNSRRALTP